MVTLKVQMNLHLTKMLKAKMFQVKNNTVGKVNIKKS